MASKASASKGSEELVGQELARSFWRQGLAEAEAGRKEGRSPVVNFVHATSTMKELIEASGFEIIIDTLQCLCRSCVRCAMH